MQEFLLISPNVELFRGAVRKKLYQTDLAQKLLSVRRFSYLCAICPI